MAIEEFGESIRQLFLYVRKPNLGARVLTDAAKIWRVTSCGSIAPAEMVIDHVGIWMILPLVN